jgi:hypothetical protein
VLERNASVRRVVVWNHGEFRAGRYGAESLSRKVEDCLTFFWFDGPVHNRREAVQAQSRNQSAPRLILHLFVTQS